MIIFGPKFVHVDFKLHSLSLSLGLISLYSFGALYDWALLNVTWHIDCYCSGPLFAWVDREMARLTEKTALRGRQLLIKDKIFIFILIKTTV